MLKRASINFKNKSVGTVRLLESFQINIYIVPEKLVAGYVEHLAQIKMRKKKKTKKETERERMVRMNRQCNDS